MRKSPSGRVSASRPRTPGRTPSAKRASCPRATWCRPSGCAVASPSRWRGCAIREAIRAQLYRDYLANILAGSRRTLDLLIGIDVNDAPVTDAEAPVFAFQKPRHASAVLLPDVDFLHTDFYLPLSYRDAIPYGDKRASAVFAGSTTAGRTITAQDVRDLSIPRLRSGVHFKGSGHVDFRLPRIIQCESAAVAEMVAALQVPAEPLSWEQQFRYRFIISMDGNGATCSRVAIGLHSQAVLAKYDSPNLLYYFGALVPWRHFVPVLNDAELVPIVETERRSPGAFGHVAEEGRAFARRYLGRAGTCGYMLALLDLYQDCLSAGRRRADGGAAQAPAPMPLIELGAHIQNVGDVWGRPGVWIGEVGSGLAVEAIAVVACVLPDEALQCAVLLDDGSLSETADASGFHGTRGAERPLRGFRITLNDDWPERFSCAVSARFTTGETVGPLASGELCVSATNAPLEAFHVEIAARPRPAASSP